MGLKFRRGTTAQKSGSLAFGEPYVNTDLQTLQIGTNLGDVTLASTSTSSVFQGLGVQVTDYVSGSRLDITGNANIGGNLTLKGQLTIGDQTSDTVNVVASLSSSLIPSATNAFDLGSSDKIWRDLYISTGSIKVVSNGTVLSSISTNANGSQTFPNGLYSQANIQIGDGSYTNIGKFEVGRRGNTPDHNTVLGIDVMPNLTTGEFNTGIGRGTLYSLTTGMNNISMGDQAGYSMTNGSGNITIGHSAGFTLADPGGYNGTPVVNTYIGDGAGVYVNNGFWTTAIGGNALIGSNSTSDKFIKNTAIGYGSGNNVTGESTNNIYIGAGAGPASQTVETYKFYVSNGEAGDQPFMYGNMSNDNRTLDINASVNISGSITATSHIGSIAATNGVISGSSQVNLQSTNGFSSFSQSIDSAISSSNSGVNTLSQSVYNTLYWPGTGLVAGITSSINAATQSLSASFYDSIFGLSSNALSYSLHQELHGDGFSTFGLSGSVSDNSSSIANLSSSIYFPFSGLSASLDSKIANNSSSIANNSSSIANLSSSIYFPFSGLSASLDTRVSDNSSSVANLNSYTASLQAGIQMTGSTVSFLGNIVVYGTQSIINSTNVEISDNILYLAPTASIDNDLGVVGHYNDGTYRHAGIFMDASDGHTWKVFNGLQTETNATIDVNGTGFTLADFKAGAFTGTSFSGQILSTNGVVSGSSQITYASISSIPSGIVSGSSQITSLLPTGTVSGSSQVIGILSSLNTTTASLNTSVSALNTFSSSTLGRLTNLESTSASVNTSVANLNTTTASLNISVANLNTTTASLNTSVSALNTASSSYETKGRGIVSGSSQISFSGVTGTVSNAQLANSTISGISLGSNLATLTIGTGLSGTSYNGSTAVTIANTGVTSNVAGTGVTVSGATGAVTISIGQSVATSANAQFNSLGIGMAASATAGRIDASGDIVAYSTSDKNFKENITPIPNALEKISKISGNTYDWKADMKEFHGFEGNDVGVIAQEIEEVLPQLVTTRETGYKAVKYDKLVALLIEGIKEQQQQIHSLTIEVEELKKTKGL